jgi:protein-S-isoprenylcysteine O-methyltransferase Ste14
MAESADTSNAIVRPPIAWAVALIVGLGAGWLYPLSFVPASVPRFWIGGGLFGFAFALAIWAIGTIRGAGTRIETNQPTTVIVTNGPFRFTRNPVYIGMLLGQTGVAIGFDNLWVLAMLVPFYLVIRYGVVAREEAYLERKFGAVYLGYKSRVRRWL